MWRQAEIARGELPPVPKLPPLLPTSPRPDSPNYGAPSPRAGRQSSRPSSGERGPRLYEEAGLPPGDGRLSSHGGAGDA